MVVWQSYVIFLVVHLQDYTFYVFPLIGVMPMLFLSMLTFLVACISYRPSISGLKRLPESSAFDTSGNYSILWLLRPCCVLQWCRSQRRNHSMQWGTWMNAEDCRGASNTETCEGWSPRLLERWACCRTLFTKCLGLRLVTRQFFAICQIDHKLTMSPAPDPAHCLSDQNGNWQYGPNSLRPQEYQTLEPINKEHKVRSCAASTAKSSNTLM